MKIQEIAEITRAEIIQQNNDCNIQELLIDSRKIKNASQSIFVAIKANRNGHDFIEDAYLKGVRCFLISVKNSIVRHQDANYLYAKDTIVALQQLAIYVRNKHNYPVIGITGSNGKTIVKEWLFQLLNQDYRIVRSPKSYNSQIGVPLSVWQMNNSHDLGIFEAGISMPGEMSMLEKIIQPKIGIFTNASEAHSEGFLNQRQKINEKMMLFRHVQRLVYCIDHHEVHEQVLQLLQQLRGDEKEQIQLFTWGKNTDARLVIKNIEKENKHSVIHAIYNEEEISITLPYTDDAYIENAIHCWSVLLLKNIRNEDIQQRMLQLQPVAMRLELLHGINDCTIINDSYNSDLTSFYIALDFLEQQRQHQNQTVILSDMFQIGKSDNELYEEVANVIQQRNISKFIGIGKSILKNSSSFTVNKSYSCHFFETTEDFLKHIHSIHFANEAILLKGARSFKFEKIKKNLEQKLHKTVLEINLSAMQHNLNVYKAHLKPNVKLMVMVKAYSYGSGSYEIANMLQFSGMVNYLTVAYADEGIALRKAGITLPIMVMNPDVSAFDRMVAWNLEPEIYSISSLNQFLSIADEYQLFQYPIHIKLDTGMHRLGFIQEDIEAIKSLINTNSRISVKSIFSHLAGSDDATHAEFTQQQATLFISMSNEISSVLPEKPLLHICNTAAIINHPEHQLDMVRLGIGIYGVDMTNKIKDKLKNISTLKTTVAQIKHIHSGETVGYGRKGKIKEEGGKIATVNIGYADGYFRDFGNQRAYMLVHGKKAPVVGSVCMDMCMIDVSAVPDIKEGDEVVVFGEEISVMQLAQWANTIPYEILTGISQRVKRLYINE